MGVKGIVLTLDSIVAMLIMVSVISLLVFFRTETISPFLTAQQLHSLSEDALNILSESTLREVTSQGLLNQYLHSSPPVLNESDLDKSAIDVIGALWSENNISEASNITKDILGSILPDNVGYEVIINNYSIYNSSDTTVRPPYSESAAEISSGRVASGYEFNQTVSGCVARAFLTSIRGKRDSSYVYFGGYVGDGNITTNISLPNFNTIIEAYMELDVSNSFSLYINGNPAGNYVKGSSGGGNMTADKWFVCNPSNPSYCSLFHIGQNTLQVNFTNRSSIGGGYFKVTFNTTELAPEEPLGYEKYNLPGINGAINLYDSFYIPGNLNSMNISLNFKTNTSVFMDVGNTTVFYGNASTNISNSSLASLLNYNFLSQRTIPIRLGHYALNATNQTGYVTDVVLTTSLASQMSNNDIPNGTSYITRLNAAKALDKIFVNIILNNTGNRVGLVSYWTPGHTDTFPTSSPYLTNNNVSLINKINTYTTQNGDRCSCCAINTAAGILTNVTRRRYIFLMSDGIADQNAPGGHCPNSQQCPLITQAQYNSLTTNGQKATVNEAYHAYLNNITVYTVGFGPTADINLLNLTSICGGGQFRNSTNYSGLVDVYENFSEQMASGSVIYEYQSIVSSSINSTLFPNSSIELNYTPLIIPYEYGEISLKRDGERIGNQSDNTYTINATPPFYCKQGRYNIYNTSSSSNVRVIDARMTSYSSNFWTDRLLVNTSATTGWKTIYNLTDFGYKYLVLGDPFTVEIPSNFITAGNNYVCIGTGFNMSNATGGSPDDRLIYSLRVKGSVGYEYNDTCELAVASAYQRLLDKIRDYVDVTTDEIEVENNTVNHVPSMWGPAIIKIRLWE